jgi:hypothetical protein
MKKHYLMYGLLAMVIASCHKEVEKSHQEEETQHNQEQRGEITASTTAAASIAVFPVRGLHNTGYEPGQFQ